MSTRTTWHPKLAMLPCAVQIQRARHELRVKDVPGCEPVSNAELITAAYTLQVTSRMSATVFPAVCHPCVPVQWVADFRIAAGPRGQLKLQQRPQLQALYDELSSGRWDLYAFQMKRLSKCTMSRWSAASCNRLATYELMLRSMPP